MSDQRPGRRRREAAAGLVARALRSIAPLVLVQVQVLVLVLVLVGTGSAVVRSGSAGGRSSDAGIAVLAARMVSIHAGRADAAPPAVAARASPVAPGARYGWPLAPVPEVRTPFRAPDQPFGPGHRGVDLVGSVGQPVLAARAGTVVFAGPVAGRGVVSVEHDDGLRTTYEPLRPAVRMGASVEAGAVIGSLEPGHGTCPPAACLHWGVRRDRLDYLDPLVLLQSPRVRLLPVPVPWPLAGAGP